jgi:hypothetical protein
VGSHMWTELCTVGAQSILGFDVATPQLSHIPVL